MQEMGMIDIWLDFCKEQVKVSSFRFLFGDNNTVIIL